MKNSYFPLAVAGGLSVFTGCAQPEVIETRRLADSALSCQQLDAEIRDAERFRKEAEKEKGFTGTNVAAALIFPLALFGTYKNIDDAMRAADERKRHLGEIYEEKNCEARG